MTTKHKAKAVAVVTQSRRPWRTTLRTALQVTTGLAALLPFVLEAIAQGDPAVLGPGAVGALAVAGAVTRVMALPQVEQFLATWAPWLAADPGPVDPPPGFDPSIEQREALRSLFLDLEEDDPRRDAVAAALGTLPEPRRRYDDA